MSEYEKTFSEKLPWPLYAFAQTPLRFWPLLTLLIPVSIVIAPIVWICQGVGYVLSKYELLP